MTPLPPERRRFQFTLRKLLAFMLLCVLFFAYTAWWMGRLRREKEKVTELVEVAREQALVARELEEVARVKAQVARDRAEANLRHAQQALARLEALRDAREVSRDADMSPGVIRQMLLEELRNPTVDPGALDLMPWRNDPDSLLP
jgi:multidrug efflux pump subunit AcrA (membrane-fusion protein)